MTHSATPRHALAMVAVAALLASGMAAAQTVYRIVGPDGRVTFSDQPPPVGAAAKAAPAANVRPGGGAGSSPLPYALQQVVNRFPVTLYSGTDCAPCASARSLLTARGVPFTERTVSSNEDIGALQRLSGDSTLPFGTIGGQQLRGFSDVEWTQFLDAAGYPKTSQLPAGYRAAAPTPLVAASTVAAPPEAEAKAAPPNRSAAPAPSSAAAPTPDDRPARTSTNPAGITF
jgi:glutaredoxin